MVKKTEDDYPLKGTTMRIPDMFTILSALGVMNLVVGIIGVIEKHFSAIDIPDSTNWMFLFLFQLFQMR